MTERCPLASALNAPTLLTPFSRIIPKPFEFLTAGSCERERVVIRRSSQYHETLVSNPHVCATCQPSAEGSPSSAVLHLPSVIYPILTPFALLCGQSSALRSLPRYLMGTRCPGRVSFYNRGQPRRGRRGSSVQSLPRGTGFPARGFGTGRTLRPPSSAPPPSAVRAPQTVVCMKYSCASLRQKAASKNARRKKVQCTVRAEKDPANIS